MSDMIFKRVEPSASTAPWIECYWIIENGDPKQVTQKIIPDGFPEIIFHFGKPYEINLSGQWERQAKKLLAGQITKYFWLRNTGESSMLGVKLKPQTLASLFEIDIGELNDKVIDLADFKQLEVLVKSMESRSRFDKRIESIESYFQKFSPLNQRIDKAIEHIFIHKGMNSVADLTELCGVSERQLERLFKKNVGLSPKFYSRIIRFSNIFQLKEQGDASWLDLTHGAGFTDQSHFIRNFKTFTGEDPTRYGFGEETMANFFMKKK